MLAAAETEERSKKCKGKESDFHGADNVVSTIATCKPEALERVNWERLVSPACGKRGRSARALTI